MDLRCASNPKDVKHYTTERLRDVYKRQVIVHWREKLYVLIRCPYRKPTQVDEERILRPAGEVLLSLIHI